MARQDDYTRARVDRIYDAIFGIFNLSPNPKKFDKSWQELRKNLSPEQVREFYVFIQNLWPENMELDDFIPKPRKNKLRALYIGRETAWNINSKISRYSLYTDEIIVPIPILNPKIIRPDYSPVYQPGMYLQQTLENIGFMINMLPWYTTKKVRLVPNPISYNRQLHEFIFDPQRAAQKESEYDDAMLNDMPQDVEEDMKDQMMRMYLSIPDEHIDEWVKSNFKNEKTHSQTDIAKYIREQRQNDPFLLLKNNYAGGEMKWMTLGSTSDVGTYIAQKAGAFLYTDNSLQWKQILSEASSNYEGSWSNLTHDFQALDFKFLDKVDSKFASEIAAEGRLELFRDFLRDLRKEITNGNDNVDDSTTREFSDRLKIAFNEAQKDWDAIDKKLIKWMSTAGTTGLISTLAQGTLNPMIPLGGFAVTAALQIVDSTRSRKHFKRTVPMAVLIDLNKENG